jgi:hypothetical protein
MKEKVNVSFCFSATVLIITIQVTSSQVSFLFSSSPAKAQIGRSYDNSATNKYF